MRPNQVWVQLHWALCKHSKTGPIWNQSSVLVRREKIHMKQWCTVWCIARAYRTNLACWACFTFRPLHQLQGNFTQSEWCKGALMQKGIGSIVFNLASLEFNGNFATNGSGSRIRPNPSGPAVRTACVNAVFILKWQVSWKTGNRKGKKITLLFLLCCSEKILCNSKAVAGSLRPGK